MRAIIFNILFYLTITFYAFCLVPFLLMPGKRPLMAAVKLVCWLTLGLARIVGGITVEWRGFDTLPKDRAYIYLAKHMSYLDVFATFYRLPNMTALAKRELFKIPIIGWVFRKLDIVPIDRGRGTAKDQMPKVIAQIVDQARPLVVYPEGTRTKLGEQRKLKSGAYYLQTDGQLDVYPIATNSGAHWGKAFFLRRPGHVVLEVGTPFVHDLDKDAFMTRVRETVVDRSNTLIETHSGLQVPPEHPK